MYYSGNGVDQSYEKAIEMWEMAANSTCKVEKGSYKSGITGAQFYLGMMNYYGTGMDVNIKKAAEWYAR